MLTETETIPVRLTSRLPPQYWPTKRLSQSARADPTHTGHVLATPECLVGTAGSYLH